MLRTMILVCLVGLTVAAGWFARGWLDGGPTAVDAKAGTCRVVRGRMEQHVKARGIVKPAPDALVRVGFPFPKDLARRISRLALVEGDTVKANAVLAQLDHDDLIATLHQLTAEVGVFQRRLDALRTLEPLEVRMAEAARAQAQAQRDQAELVHNRLAKLRAGTAASVQEWEIAVNELAVMKAKFEHADTNVEQVRAHFRTDIATLEAQLKQAEAALESVQVQIRWCTASAPLDAQVFAIHQRQGELTSGQPNAPLLTLLDPNQLQVHLFVDETDFGRVKLGQPATLRVESYPDQVLKGRIVRLLPQPILQENVVYYLVVVEVAEEQRHYLRADMTALGHVQAGVNESALWLPLAAVRSRPDGWYVRRAAQSAAGGPSRPVETAVQIGWKDQGRVEIRAGLAEGDEVLLEP